MEEKECNVCNKLKILNFFHKSKSGILGRHNTCKECRSKLRKELKFEPIKEGTKLCFKCNKELNVENFYKDKSSTNGLQTYCKKCSVSNTKKWGSTFEGFLKKLYKDIQNNSERKSKKIDVCISIDDIKDIYNKQNGLCALTGIPLTYTIQNSRNTENIVNKYNISVDRIDSTKDYVKDNIQLVCAIINRMKMDLSESTFIELCKKVADYEKI